MKKHLSTIALILVLLAGVSLLLYPTVSDYWNARHASKAVADYTQNVQALDQDAYDELLAAAEDYNRSLLTRENGFFLTEEQQAQYESLLDISGTGIMGYIEIPSINVSLPIYHGTSDSVLQIAVGHLDWTSLPVGGEKHTLRPLRPSRTAQRKAVYQSRSDCRRRYVHHPRARRGFDLRG